MRLFNFHINMKRASILETNPTGESEAEKRRRKADRGAQVALFPAEILADTFAFLSRYDIQEKISFVNCKFNRIVFSVMKNTPPYMSYDELIFSNDNENDPRYIPRNFFKASDLVRSCKTLIRVDQSSNAHVRSPAKQIELSPEYFKQAAVPSPPAFLRFIHATVTLYMNNPDEYVYEPFKHFFHHFGHAITTYQLTLEEMDFSIAENALKTLSGYSTIPPRNVKITIGMSTEEHRPVDIFAFFLIRHCQRISIHSKREHLHLFTSAQLVKWIHSRRSTDIFLYGENDVDFKELMTDLLEAFLADEEVRRYKFAWFIKELSPSRVVIQDYYRLRKTKIKTETNEELSISFGFNKSRDYQLIMIRKYASSDIATV